MKPKPTDCLLGIDTGTSSTKVVLVDLNGRLVAQASAPHTLQSPKPGWNEQNPKQWWQATVKAIRKLPKRKQILAIGLSGQMHGSVFVDKKGTPLRPALLWNDQRTEKECQEITERIGGRKKLIKKVSNSALTGYTAPKILWLRNHEPNVFSRVHQILLPKDYIRWQLTQRFATDVSDASGTLLLNVKKRRWSKSLLKALKLDPTLLPDPFESSDVAGYLTATAARQLGLPKGIPVVAGAGDQPAAAVGMGVVTEGVVSANIGTSGVVFAHSDTPVTNQDGLLQSFCHAVTDKWCVFGCMLSAGSSLDWARSTLYPDIDDVDTAFSLMSREARKLEPQEAPFFLPYLEGERCPHPDPSIRASWIGLNRSHGRAAMTRAVFEGITFGMADQIALLKQQGIPIREVRCAGGGSTNRFWRQLQTNVYQTKTVTLSSEHASAVGAALLAGVGAGLWKSVPQACKKTVRTQSEMRPERLLAAQYQQKHRQYRDCYPALATL